MSIRNEILGSKVRSSKSNSGQLFRDSVEPNNPLTRNTGESRSLIETEVQDSNKTEQVDLVDLDLKIPSTTGKFHKFIEIVETKLTTWMTILGGMNRSHSFNGESSSEEDEANECLLKI